MKMKAENKHGLWEGNLENMKNMVVKMGEHGEVEVCMNEKTCIWYPGETEESESVRDLFGRKKCFTVVGKKSVGMRYEKNGEQIELHRTVEYRPEAGNFTVLDEIGNSAGEEKITESLYSVWPIHICDGKIVSGEDDARITILIRNQENLRIEKADFYENDQKEGYCLKWDVRREQGYTCCQIEL